MRPLPPSTRLLIASLGVGVSAAAWFLLIPRFIDEHSMPVLQTAVIDQYRTNLTASTGGGELPTFATVKVDFPQQMSLQSSREIVVEYARFIAAGGGGLAFVNGALVPDSSPPRPGAKVERLRRSLSARLDSPAFETTKSEITVPEESPLPCKLRWVITPKKAGQHLALIELADMIAPATDPSLFGTTTVTVGGRPAALDRGTQLPLAIEVIDNETRFAWLWKALGSLPGLAAFVLTYPLVIDALKRRLRRRKAEPSKPTQHPDMGPHI